MGESARRIWRSVHSTLRWWLRISLGLLLGALGDGLDESANSWKANHRQLSVRPAQRELPGLLVDPSHMLPVFQRELPLLAERPIRVTRCDAKRSNWRKSSAQGRCNVVYEVGIEEDGVPEREIVILGIAPATPTLRSSMEAHSLLLRAHPWTTPFREPAVHLESLGLMLLLFPLDPLMPGLGEITGSDGARLLAGMLPECRSGAGIERIECELVHYKPFDRAVLRIRATFRDRSAGERTLYAKFFAEDQPEGFQENLALWSAARSATCLRLPEPLGYDAGRRMLVSSEAPGDRQMNEWVKLIERGEPLPPGVDRERLERCARVAAGALGELQRSGIRPASRRTFRDDLERLKRDRDLLPAGAQSRCPDLAARVDSLVERMEDLAPVEERLVPAHGAYRHKQMLGDEKRLTVIDWDGLSLANHALDAATFLGRLLREPTRRPGSASELERMALAFRSTFLELEPVAARDLDLYEGFLLTNEVLRSLRHPEKGHEIAMEVRCLAAAELSLRRVEARGRAI